MKKNKVLLIPFLLIAMALSGCSKEPQAPADTDEAASVVGYIVIEDNTLYVDEVELVTLEDEARMEELGLTQVDLPNGYHFHNEEIAQAEYELTEDTTYTFVDVEVLFVGETDERKYTTNEKDEFVQHLSVAFTDTPPAQTVPFFMEISDGKVVSIVEEFEYTI